MEGKKKRRKEKETARSIGRSEDLREFRRIARKNGRGPRRNVRVFNVQEKRERSSKSSNFGERKRKRKRKERRNQERET